MCGRYVSPDQASIERAWRIDRASSTPFTRRFNVQPTTAVPMLRLEDIAGKPMWREPIRHARCLLPAEGWYEWQDTPGGKQPHHITRRDRRPFCFAGLYAIWRDTLSCAILTTQALGPVAAVHPRMPVVLSEKDHAAWLEPAMRDAAAATALALEPMAPEDFLHYPVSRRVNSASNEGPDLIEPLHTPAAD